MMQDYAKPYASVASDDRRVIQAEYGSTREHVVGVRAQEEVSMKKSIRYVTFLTLMVAGSACGSADGGGSSQDPSAASVGEATTLGDRTPATAIEHQRVRLFKAASQAAWSRTSAVAPKLVLALTSDNAPSALDAASRLARESYAADGLSFGEVDIDALVALVMMETSKEVEDELKAQLAEMQALTAAKQAQRAIIRKVGADIGHNAQSGREQLAFAPGGCFANVADCLAFAPPHDADIAFARALSSRGTASVTTAVPATLADLQSVADGLRARLDSMNEMSETQSMRLQMMMDRRAKLIEALSNILKKIEATQEGIVANLK